MYGLGKENIRRVFPANYKKWLNGLNVYKDEKHFYDYSNEEGNGNHSINMTSITE